MSRFFMVHCVDSLVVMSARNSWRHGNIAVTR